MKKYKLTSETLDHNGVRLHRIQALCDFRNVKAGDYGGWIESEHNLSHEDLAWVYNEAKVWDRARISGNAIIDDESVVYGEAIVSETAVVLKEAQIFGHSRVRGDSFVADKAKVYGYAIVEGDATVRGESEVFGEAIIQGHVIVSGEAKIYGDVDLQGNIVVQADSDIGNDSDYVAFKIPGESYYLIYTKSNDIFSSYDTLDTSKEFAERGPEYSDIVDLIKKLI